MQRPLKINTMDSITDRSSDQLRSVYPESCVNESAQSGLPGRTAEYLSTKGGITAKHSANAVSPQEDDVPRSKKKTKKSVDVSPLIEGCASSLLDDI